MVMAGVGFAIVILLVVAGTRRSWMPLAREYVRGSTITRFVPPGVRVWLDRPRPREAR
jgi:hypothetical protein